jgi:hypothetical protein
MKSESQAVVGDRIPGISPFSVRAHYYGVFLSFQCPFSCSFCVRRFHTDRLAQYEELSGNRWIDYFSMLQTDGIPLVFQGGEPGLHRDFPDIIHFLSPLHRIQIVTNLAFDVRKFAKMVDPSLMNRDSDLIPIVANFHPEEFSPQEFVERAFYLHAAGFRLRVTGFTDPTRRRIMDEMTILSRDHGLDFKVIDFLDWYQDRFYSGIEGLLYSNAGMLDHEANRLPALLYAPNGRIFGSHHHLYENVQPLGHIFDRSFIYPTQPIANDFCGAHQCAEA